MGSNTSSKASSEHSHDFKASSEHSHDFKLPNIPVGKECKCSPVQFLRFVSRCKRFSEMNIQNKTQFFESYSNSVDVIVITKFNQHDTYHCSIDFHLFVKDQDHYDVHFLRSDMIAKHTDSEIEMNFVISNSRLFPIRKRFRRGKSRLFDVSDCRSGSEKDENEPSMRRAATDLDLPKDYLNRLARKAFSCCSFFQTQHRKTTILD